MKLILGGTSTSHKIISELTTSNYLVSLATEYGYNEFSEKYPDKIVLKRFSVNELTDFIKENSISEVIDTTHPHAKEITRTAIEACVLTGVDYIDKIRELEDVKYEKMYTFKTYEEAVEYIKENEYKSVLITTGSNHINKYAYIADRSYARVLAYEKSIEACVDAGFHYSRIIGMQGPFSEEFNMALMKELKTDCLVTKNSGKGSGYAEKISACEKMGIDIILVQPE